MRLKYQLFLALLAGGGLLIALLAAVADWSFNRGFLDYVNRVERQRLEPVREALLDGYQRQGDWRWIEGQPEVWRALLRDNLRRDSRRSRPPPFERSLVLADPDRRLLTGRPVRLDEVNWTPLVRDDVVLGFLGDRPLARVPEGLDRVFAARQRRSVLISSLALLPVSALLAWLLTTRIVRPLDRLNAAVARIADGDFAARLPDRRGDELGDLARRVNRLAATLESNLRARRRWLAEISHELRTPVAVLQAELEALQDGVTTVDDAALESLHGETTRLSRLIDDLHDLTLADAGALDYRFERLDLVALVSARLDQARQRLDEAGLSVTLDGVHGDTSNAFVEGPSATARDTQLEIDGDAQRLAQLIDNLMQNTLRYTAAGGRLHVTLDRRDGQARMTWADSAPGVSPDDLPHLFDPLYRVDASRRRATGGSGLGLAIVGKIAEAHGGRVSAAPSPLGGLTVALTLPLAVEAST